MSTDYEAIRQVVADQTTGRGRHEERRMTTESLHFSRDSNQSRIGRDPVRG